MACGPQGSYVFFKNSAICFDAHMQAKACDMNVAFENQLIEFVMTPNRLGLYGQVNKRTWWMPWRQKAMKDVVACDKLRGAGKYASIRRFPNGETHRLGGTHD